MEDILTGLVESLCKVIACVASKRGRAFLHDVVAILAGRQVKNRPRDKSVC